jgi:hypothetical protein
MQSDVSTVESSPQASGFLKPAWAKVKLLCVLLSFLSGAFSNHDDGSNGGELKSWVIPLAAMWMFGGTLFMRSRMPPRKWTEREFWATNPFRNLFSFHDKTALVFFLHFGALCGIAFGLGALSRATFQIEDGRTFHGLLALSVGASTWIGARLRDWFTKAA